MSQAKRQSSSGSSFLYITLWIVAALGAMGYIANLMINTMPSQTAVQTAMSTPAQQPKEKMVIENHLKGIQSTIALSNKQLKELNNKYYALENKIDKVNGKVAQFNKDHTALAKRIKKIEENLGSVTGTLAKPLINVKTALNTKSQDKQGNNLQGAGLDTQKIEKQINQTTPPVEERAKKQIPIPILLQAQPPLKSEMIPFKPEVTRTMFAVSLGNYPDLKKLKNAWVRLTTKYSSSLAALNPRYVTLVVDNKPQYKLVTGPLPNALDAAKICYHLQQLKTYCKQTVYQGSDI